MKSQSILLPLALVAPTVSAWGQLPHRTVALLSTRFLLPETAQWIRTILPPQEPIASAACWADYFSHTPEGRWSGRLHYIDAHDSPSTGVCGINFTRDCEEGGMCIVGGLVNVTRQLQTPIAPHEIDHDFQYTAETSTAPHWRSPHHLALRFLLHFVGDIHQPLHTEALSRGGNSIQVEFMGRHANLHSTWDSLIPEYLQGGRTPRLAITWANNLQKAIDDADKSAAAPKFRSDWVGECFADIEADVAKNGGVTAERTQLCALEWAQWANNYVCSYVFAKGVGTDGRTMVLGKEYAEGARELIDELVGMAGWRLAGFLNLIAVGKLGLDIGEAATGAVHNSEQFGFVKEMNVLAEEL